MGNNAVEYAELRYGKPVQFILEDPDRAEYWVKFQDGAEATFTALQMHSGVEKITTIEDWLNS